MSDGTNKINTLRGLAQFSLFVSSYIFLFIIIILRQISGNWDYLKSAEFTKENFYNFLSKFGLSTFLIGISILGIIGFFITFHNIKGRAENGSPVKVKDIKNKSNESIGYIATYLIPFLFQGFNTLVECISLLLLLAVIYRIYINSTLLLVNPIINFCYATYEIEYEVNKIKKNGLIISRNRFLQEGERIKIYEIGYKLYFAKEIEKNDTE